MWGNFKEIPPHPQTFLGRGNRRRALAQRLSLRGVTEVTDKPVGEGLAPPVSINMQSRRKRAIRESPLRARENRLYTRCRNFLYAEETCAFFFFTVAFADLFIFVFDISSPYTFKNKVL